MREKTKSINCKSNKGNVKISWKNPIRTNLECITYAFRHSKQKYPITAKLMKKSLLEVNQSNKVFISYIRIKFNININIYRHKLLILNTFVNYRRQNTYFSLCALSVGHSPYLSVDPLTSRRLCEVGESTTSRLDCHWRFSYPQTYGLSFHPPILQNRLSYVGLLSCRFVPPSIIFMRHIFTHSQHS